jgi:D-proline reductase (dithiol) PrdB
MATYDDLGFNDKAFMLGYPFARYALDPTPCTRMSKTLRQARVALVTTAGLYTGTQPGFDPSIKMGDSSFREIPLAIETNSLSESHKSKGFDHAGITADKNLAFPLDRFRELVSSGKVGQLNRRHFSFMGSIVGPRRLIDESAPEVAEMLSADGVDVAFLTPV